jgi:hypothetical protein
MTLIGCEVFNLVKMNLIIKLFAEEEDKQATRKVECRLGHAISQRGEVVEVRL